MGHFEAGRKRRKGKEGEERKGRKGREKTPPLSK